MRVAKILAKTAKATYSDELVSKKNHMKQGAHMRYVALFLAASSLALSGNANADVCEAVLKYKAFNINDNKTNSDYRSSVLDELCKTHWTSRSEFESRAKNLNTSGKYMEIFSGSLDAAQNETQQSLNKDYDNLCTKKDYRVVSRFFSDTHIQSTDKAVDTWGDCVFRQKRIMVGGPSYTG